MNQYHDATHLWLLAHGRLPPAQVEAWLHEPDDSVRVAAETLTYQRIASFDDHAVREWQVLEAWRNRNYRWGMIPAYDGWQILEPQRRAVWSRRSRMLAAALLGGPLPGHLAAWLRERAGDWSDPQRVGPVEEYMPSLPLLETCRNGLTGVNRHRLIRAAAQVVLAWRASALPVSADGSEIDRRLLAATALLPPLVYERLSPTRFRLGFDPQVPLNPLLLQQQDSRDLIVFGRTAACWQVWDGDWWLELDCARIQR